MPLYGHIPLDLVSPLEWSASEDLQMSHQPMQPTSQTLQQTDGRKCNHFLANLN